MTTININDLTLGQIKEIQALTSLTVLAVPSPEVLNNPSNNPYSEGKNYIVRTVTMIFTGRLVEVWPQELVLVDAAWIPETERYMQFVDTGAVRECEPFPEGRRLVIGRGAVLDAITLEKPLPRSQK